MKRYLPTAFAACIGICAGFAVCYLCLVIPHSGGKASASAPKLVEPRDSATLTPEQAGSRAQQLANERAQTLYNCQPLHKAKPAQFAKGHWSWRQLQAQAKGDMEAKVEFEADGAEPKVSVIRLESVLSLQ